MVRPGLSSAARKLSALSVAVAAVTFVQIVPPSISPASADVVAPLPVAQTVVLTATGDTWVQSGLDSKSKPTSPELRVGTSNIGITKARSYATFDISSLGAITSGSVVSASVTLSNFAAGSCSGSPILMSPVTSAWSLPGITWGAQPTTSAIGSSTNATGHGATGCAAEGPVVFDATALVRSWAAGGANNGVQFRALNEGANASFRKFRSLENGNPALVPQLTVTIDNPPATPTDLSVTPGTTINDVSFLSSATPTIAATVSDPDGGLVKSYVVITKGSTTVWTGSSTAVESGSTASLTVPADTLSEGAIYTIAVYAVDSSGVHSGSSATRTVQVDTVAPTVTISSPQFANGTWTNTMPASASFTLDGSADVGGFYVDFDGTTGTVAAGTNGDKVLPWSPTAGWHRFAVTPVDRAGNLGTQTVFTFGTGGPGLTSPVMWAESVDTFDVEASAAPNATFAYVQWRIANEASWRVATKLTKASDGTAWTGALPANAARSTTGSLLWHPTQETFGNGKLVGPALLEVRVCFNYPAQAGVCTGSRYVGLYTAPPA